MFVSIIPVGRLSLSLSIGQSDNPPHLFLSCLGCGLLFLSTLWPWRKVMDHGGNGHVQLAPCNLEILQKSNYLFHSAHNCPLTLTGRVCVCFTCVTDVCIRSVCSNILCYSQGLAMESLEANKLLWKSHPKTPQVTWLQSSHDDSHTSPVKYDLSRFLLLYDHFYLRLDHLVYDVAPQTNPIKLSCYMDEDAVGKLKKLAMASSPQNMGEYVLSRYASYICVRWLRRTEW